MKFGIDAFQGDVKFEARKIGFSLPGTVDPFTGKPQVRRMWNTRKGAQTQIEKIQNFPQCHWDRIEIIEIPE